MNSAELCAQPNFAVLCSFFNKFGSDLGLSVLPFHKLELMFSFDDEGRVDKDLIDLHARLLRKIGLNVMLVRWETSLMKFCALQTNLQAEYFQLERFGYAHTSLPTKLEILKCLCERQFDFNGKFKEQTASLIARDLRGRDELNRLIRTLKGEPVLEEEEQTPAATAEPVGIDSDPSLNGLDEPAEVFDACIDDDDNTRDSLTRFVTKANAIALGESTESMSSAPSSSCEGTPAKSPEKKSAKLAPLPVAGLKKSEKVAHDSQLILDCGVKRELEMELDDEDNVDASGEAALGPTTLAKAEGSNESGEEVDEKNNEAGPESNEFSVINDVKKEDVSLASDGVGLDADLDDVKPGVSSAGGCDGGGKGEELDENATEVGERPGESEKNSGEKAAELTELKSEETNASKLEAIVDASKSEVKQVAPKKPKKPFGRAKRGAFIDSYQPKTEKKTKKTKEKAADTPAIVNGEVDNSAEKASMDDIPDEVKAFIEVPERRIMPLRGSRKLRIEKLEKLEPESSESEAEEEAAKSKSDDECLEESDEEDDGGSDESEPEEYRPSSIRAKSGSCSPRKRRQKAVNTDSEEEEVKKDKKKASSDTQCGKCKKSKNPELLLLCDQCDNAWHTWCLKPPLWYVPDDDWFCPHCQHTMLLDKLGMALEHLDEELTKRAAEETKKRQERDRLLRQVNIDNIIIQENKEEDSEDEDDDKEDESSSENDVDNGHSDDERENRHRSTRKRRAASGHRRRRRPAVDRRIRSPSPPPLPIALTRSRRQNVTKIDYSFTHFDEMIEDAVDEATVTEQYHTSTAHFHRPSGAGKGKDINNIMQVYAKQRQESEEMASSVAAAAEPDVLVPLVPAAAVSGDSLQNGNETAGEHSADSADDATNDSMTERKPAALPPASHMAAAPAGAAVGGALKKLGPLPGGKQPKKAFQKHKLTDLDVDNWTESDTDEYKASEGSEFEEPSEPSESEYEDELPKRRSSGRRGPGRRTRSDDDFVAGSNSDSDYQPRRSSRSKKPSRRKIGSGSSDSEDSIMASAKRKRGRKGAADSDDWSNESSSDEDEYRPSKKRKRPATSSSRSKGRRSKGGGRRRRRPAAKPQSRVKSKRYEEDSDYETSSRKSYAKRSLRRHAQEQDDSDDGDDANGGSMDDSGIKDNRTSKNDRVGQNINGSNSEKEQSSGSEDDGERVRLSKVAKAKQKTKQVPSSSSEDDAEALALDLNDSKQPPDDSMTPAESTSTAPISGSNDTAEPLSSSPASASLVIDEAARGLTPDIKPSISGIGMDPPQANPLHAMTSMVSNSGAVAEVPPPPLAPMQHQPSNFAASTVIPVTPMPDGPQFASLTAVPPPEYMYSAPRPVNIPPVLYRAPLQVGQMPMVSMSGFRGGAPAPHSYSGSQPLMSTAVMKPRPPLMMAGPAAQPFYAAPCQPLPGVDHYSGLQPMGQSGASGYGNSFMVAQNVGFNPTAYQSSAPVAAISGGSALQPVPAPNSMFLYAANAQPAPHLMQAPPVLIDSSVSTSNGDGSLTDVISFAIGNN